MGWYQAGTGLILVGSVFESLLQGSGFECHLSGFFLFFLLFFFLIVQSICSVTDPIALVTDTDTLVQPIYLSAISQLFGVR